MDWIDGLCILVFVIIGVITKVINFVTFGLPDKGDENIGKEMSESRMPKQ